MSASDRTKPDRAHSRVRETALLHPDRHRDPALKPAADARFAQLQRAYETLSDPAKRAIYDEFGEAGLKTQWEVSTKGKTPAEVRCSRPVGLGPDARSDPQFVHEVPSRV